MTDELDRDLRAAAKENLKRMGVAHRPSKQEVDATTYAKLREFFDKYAIGDKWPPPSCLVCGQVVVDAAISHAELAGIVVCFPCRDARSEIERLARDYAGACIDRDSATEQYLMALKEVERLRAALEAADSLYEDALRVASDVGLHEQDDLWAALETYEDKRDPLKRAADETSTEQP